MNNKIVYGLLVVSLLLLGSIFLFTSHFSNGVVIPDCIIDYEGECLTQEAYDNRDDHLVRLPANLCPDEDTSCYIDPRVPPLQ